MDLKSKDIQNQYKGYKNTPLLWHGNAVLGLYQFKIPEQNDVVFNEHIPEILRLGKRVERFVSQEFNQHKEIEVIAENIQVQQEKTTLGELDCLLKINGRPVHVEIVYKFYLFDKKVGTSEIEHWIGPNRKDTLVNKLTKLKEKQLPLLHSEQARPMLKELKLDIKAITQKVHFKAQLFVPYQEQNLDFESLNEACLNGFYLRHTEIAQFADCKFYIPTKINWLMDIQTQVNWLNYKRFSEQITTILNKKTSPLCWIKFPNGTMQKFFVVWWY